jgi:PAS domain S-box-containing protein
MQQQKSLVLILARDLADKLASAMFVVDHEGTLVYFNEPAERILGRSFADVGPAAMQDWAIAFGPLTVEGRPLTLDELPLTVALRERQPVHKQLAVTTPSGEVRQIAATAFPLFARTDEFEGAAAVFWELDT